jgi:translation initiation factor IF-3
MARGFELDLVEVAPNANPPVCRIMDYGKFKYEEGHKVKITLQFRGREMAHPELGSKILDDVLEAVGPAAKVDTQARLEGRAMSMVLSPDKKAQEAMKKAASEAEHDGAGADTEADQESQGVTDAEDEDVEDRQEAVQEDGNGQAAPRTSDAPAPVREEVVDADASS